MQADGRMLLELMALAIYLYWAHVDAPRSMTGPNGAAVVVAFYV